jgi:hypothetical protein
MMRAQAGAMPVVETFCSDIFIFRDGIRVAEGV